MAAPNKFVGVSCIGSIIGEILARLSNLPLPTGVKNIVLKSNPKITGKKLYLFNRKKNLFLIL